MEKCEFRSFGVPGHALHEPFAEMVVGNCYLHVNVLCITVAMAQKHDLQQLISQKMNRAPLMGKFEPLFESWN